MEKSEKPYRQYRFSPLQPGQVISNEPGVYGHFSMSIDGTHYDEMIGIRIEDDVLVTKEGNRVLSADAPKTIADIESLMLKAKKARLNG